MKTCIIYASTHGSTERCAKELGNLLQAETINIHKIFVAQKPITFRWWEECHAPFYP